MPTPTGESRTKINGGTNWFGVGHIHIYILHQKLEIAAPFLEIKSFPKKMQKLNKMKVSASNEVIEIHAMQ